MKSGLRGSSFAIFLPDIFNIKVLCVSAICCVSQCSQQRTQKPSDRCQVMMREHDGRLADMLDQLSDIVKAFEISGF